MFELNRRVFKYAYFQNQHCMSNFIRNWDVDKFFLDDYFGNNQTYYDKLKYCNYFYLWPFIV